MLAAIIAILRSFLFIAFTGFGLTGLVTRRTSLRPPGLVLVMGYAISCLLFYGFFFLCRGRADVGLALILCLSSVANVYYLFARCQLKRFFKKMRLHRSIYLLTILVLSFLAFSYVFVGSGRYWHSANEDIFDGLNGRAVFLTHDLEKSLAERKLSDIYDDLTAKRITYSKSITQVSGRFATITGFLQYSSLALFSLVSGKLNGMDAFVVQALINFVLFAFGVYSASRYLFRQPVPICLSTAFIAVLGNYYFSTYISGHIGSMMYNAVLPFALLYTVRSVSMKRITFPYVAIPLFFLLFLLAAYPYPILFLATPLLVYAVFLRYVRARRMDFFALCRNYRFLLLVCCILLLGLVLSYFVGAPYRLHAMSKFRSVGTSLNYVGIGQFWGIWFSGIPYVGSPLWWVITQPILVVGSLCLCALLILSACIGVGHLLRQRQAFVLCLVPILLAYGLVMRISIRDSYYFYKYLYINQWIFYLFTVIGLFAVFQHRRRLVKIATASVVLFWVGANAANNILALTLICGRDFNRHPEQYDLIFSAPKRVLAETFIALPYQDHADLVEHLYREKALAHPKNKLRARYILTEKAAEDVLDEKAGDIVWQSDRFVIRKRSQQDIAELASYFSVEGGSFNIDLHEHPDGIINTWVARLFGGLNHAGVFRWIAAGKKGATLINVARRTSDSDYLYLCTMASYTIKTLPFKVTVRDAKQQLVGQVPIDEDYHCQSLKVAAFTPPFYLLNAQQAPYTSPLDRRQLAYKLMRIGFSASPGVEDLYAAHASEDIFDAKSLGTILEIKSLRLGRHWYPYEKYKNDAFRWVNRDAEFVISGKGRILLTFMIERGPSAGKSVIQVSLNAATGQRYGVCAVSQKTDCVFAVDLVSNQQQHFYLQSDAKGQSIALDPRILNFRVLHIGVRPA